MRNKISCDKTIALIKLFLQEKERLREVFRHIIPFILFSAKQNIALTGSCSNIDDSNGKNGNFQQLAHTATSFDNVMKDHLEKNAKIHYLSPKTQNELISIIVSKIKYQILEDVMASKYFSIIVKFNQIIRMK